MKRLRSRKRNLIEETMIDFKELLEDNILAYQQDRYYNMSISDLQKEADKIGFDISKLF
jgi:hypothetical protein